MNNKFRNLIFGLLIFPVTALVISSCSDADGSDTANSKKPNNNEKIVNVEVMPVATDEFNNFITLVGTLKASEEASISAEEGGVIEAFKHEKGSYVSKGDVIFEIDNQILKANLDAAKAQFDLAQVTYEKQEQIFKDNVNSEFQVLQSKYQRDAAKANYELSKARYEKTFVRAPFSGIVDEKLFNVGEVVSPLSPVVKLINSNTLKIEAGVPERYVTQIKKGTKVNIKIRELENENIQGTVNYVGSSVSDQNRTFPVEIIIPNKNNKLKPEMNAELMITLEKFKDVAVIPEEVITKTDLGDVVYVANDSIAQMRVVNVLSRYNNKAAIDSGLQRGDKLVVVGYQNLIQGLRVNVVNEGKE